MAIRAAWLLVCAALLVAGPVFASPTRIVTLRWIQPEGAPPEGFLVLIGDHPGNYHEVIPVGLPPAPGGISSFALTLPARRDVHVAMLAYNAAGLSPISNDLFFPAVSLPAPTEDPVIALGHASPRPRTPLVSLTGQLFEGPDISGAITGQHLAWCDLDGDAIPELVQGQDASGLGTVAVIDVESGRLRATLVTPGSASTRPACGDIDGDGRDEIVVGLDADADAWVQIFEDWHAFLVPMQGPALDAWGRLPRDAWRGRDRPGAVQPALGDLDGDGRAEIVIAVDHDSGGFVRVHDDAQAGLAPLELGPVSNGWLRVAQVDDVVWPALGDVDGDRRDELVFGFGTPGLLRILDDPVERSEESTLDGWYLLPEAAAAGASLHPALGDLDFDGRAELVLGFGGALTDSLYVLTDALGAKLPHPATPSAGWIDVSGHGLTGPVFPAVRSQGHEPTSPPLLLGHAGTGAGIPVAHTDGWLETIAAGGLATGLPARLAWCDISGSGRPILVAGYGPGGGGILRLAAVGQGVVGTHFELPLGPTDYATANGELRPACGDIDGDGRDELVVGPGPGGGGEIFIRDDGYSGFGPWPGLPKGTLQWSNWPSYLPLGGGARPAVGDMDGDGRDEIVIGLGFGGEGWLRILDDATTGFGPLAAPPLIGGWLQWSRLQAYVTASGASRPVLGDVDGDGRDELAIGFDAGGGGRVVILDDALGGFEPLVGTGLDPGIRIPTSGDGATYPAFVDVDGDGRDELVVGFGPGDEGRLYVLDDALAGFVPHPHTPLGDGNVPLGALGLQGPVAPAHGTP